MIVILFSTLYQKSVTGRFAWKGLVLTPLKASNMMIKSSFLTRKMISGLFHTNVENILTKKLKMSCSKISCSYCFNWMT